MKKNSFNIRFGLNGLVMVCLLAMTAIQCNSGVSSSELEETKAAVNGNANTNPGTAPGTTNTTNTDPNAVVAPTNATDPQAPQVDPNQATTMKFAEEVFDFGSIKEGEKVTHVFKFKNTGNKPLTISNAKGSCGCTVPDYPKTPIAPGQSGEIKVEFNSTGKKGAETKYVTINANTIPSETRLTIKADVIKTETK